MAALMKSISGIRGIVGETMTPELAVQTAKAFAEFTKHGKIVIGSDGRCTGNPISSLVESTLVLCGCEVVDVGIVPTPTIQVMVEELGAAGGIIVSASHNPIEWNAFKLIASDGSFLGPVEIQKLFRLMDRELHSVRWDEIGQAFRAENPGGVHLKRVTANINIPLIKKMKYTVALDSVNASGSYITKDLLSVYACKFCPVYCEITGTFPRVAEPLPENLSALSEAVIKNSADIGFAQDPDADRLAVVNEKGIPIGEEYTLALVSEHILSKRKGPVVVNLSTTKAIEDIAKKHGVPFFRSKVGEIHVVEEMKKRKAVIGGEGNGGVISPEVHYGRDSLAGISYILEMMAERQKTVSELVAELPVYKMIKSKVRFNPDSLAQIYSLFRKQCRGELFDDSDGLRIDFEKEETFSGGWVHVRPSNTEPVCRIICEGKTIDQAEAIFNFSSKIIKSV